VVDRCPSSVQDAGTWASNASTARRNDWPGVGRKDGMAAFLNTKSAAFDSRYI